MLMASCSLEGVANSELYYNIIIYTYIILLKEVI